jgi:hypothetical protein
MEGCVRTREDVIRVMDGREKKEGLSVYCDHNYQFCDVVDFYDSTPDDADDKTLLVDEIEQRLEELCRSRYEYDKFMRLLFPAEELVQWNVTA